MPSRRTGGQVQGVGNGQGGSTWPSWAGCRPGLVNTCGCVQAPAGHAGPGSERLIRHLPLPESRALVEAGKARSLAIMATRHPPSQPCRR
jgi:hypothetical protein